MDAIDGGYINYASSVDSKKYPIFIKYKDTKISDLILSGDMSYIPDVEDFIEDHEPRSFRTLWEMIEAYEEQEKYFYVDFEYEEDILKCYLVLRGYLKELQYKIPQSEDNKIKIITKVKKFQNLIKKSTYKIMSENNELKEKYYNEIRGSMDMLTGFFNDQDLNLGNENNNTFTYKSEDSENKPVNVFGI